LFSNQTVSVYIDGVFKQQGEGWSPDDFGITVTGGASDVAIYSQYTDYGPRGLQQLNSLTYAGIIIGLIIATVIIFSMTEFKGYRHKQKTETKTA
jgi:hypothetical protein